MKQSHKMITYINGKGSLTMGYFDNESINKYKKFKNRKNLIDMFFYLLIDDD
jgi:hypothetical protein